MSYASYYDVSSSSAVRELQELSGKKGHEIASSHYPYVVLREEQELRAEAATQCDKWWNGLYRHNDYMNLLSGVKRVYTAAFVARYRERIEELEQAEEEKKEAARRRAEREKGARVEIRSQRQRPDGVRYVIDFVDPARMTQAISFLVCVKDDGVVELEEA